MYARAYFHTFYGYYICITDYTYVRMYIYVNIET